MTTGSEPIRQPAINASQASGHIQTESHRFLR